MARPKGSATNKDKPFRDALRMELAAAGGDLKRLRRIANALLEAAESGQLMAIKEVADRLDGRPPQAVVGDDTQPIEHVFRWKSGGYRRARHRLRAPAPVRRLPRAQRALRLHRHPPARRQDRSLRARPAARRAGVHARAPALRLSVAVPQAGQGGGLGLSARRHGAGARARRERDTKPSCASTIPTAARSASMAPTITRRCAGSISTAWCSTNTPTWIRAPGPR